MTGETLDQIITILFRGDLTPAELYAACKEDYKMDTLAFSNAIIRLEEIGLVRRVSVMNKDNSATTVYRLDHMRTKEQKY